MDNSKIGQCYCSM